MVLTTRTAHFSVVDSYEVAILWDTGQQKMGEERGIRSVERGMRHFRWLTIFKVIICANGCSFGPRLLARPGNPQVWLALGSSEQRAERSASHQDQRRKCRAFARARPSTRWNSPSLRVANRWPKRRQVAAITRSWAPIRRPLSSRIARNYAWRRAVGRSKGWTEGPRKRDTDHIGRPKEQPVPG